MHLVYDEIANHFHKTRVWMWPKVIEFIESLPAQSTVLDVGCGNGRNTSMRPNDLFYVGLDISSQLLRKVVGRGVCSVAAGQEHLPFRSNSFDAIMSIAVVHHIVDTSGRETAMSEIERCLAPGGTALVYVWIKEQKKFAHLGQDVLIPWQLQKKHAASEQPKSNTEEDYVPSQTLKRKRDVSADDAGEGRNPIKKTLWRYYHLFEKGELEQLFKNTGSLTIIESGKQYNNWYVIVKKAGESTAQGVS